MKKQGRFKHSLALLLILFPFFCSAYYDGDVASWTATGIPGAVSWGAGNWAVYSGGAWVYNPAYVPLSSDTVYILGGYTMTVDAAGDSCYNLIIENGSQLYANSAVTSDLYVYGAFISDSGTVGNPGTYDAIVFDIEGSNCIISGPGTFEASRIRKTFKALPSKNNTNLTISMNIKLTYNATSKCADIYNNVSTGTGSAFNITFSAGTVDSLWSYGLPHYGDISIDGTEGKSNGPDRWGSDTVYGTLVIADTLYLTSQDTGHTCNWVIGTGGTVVTTNVSAGPSGFANGKHSLTMYSGSLLDVVGTPFANLGNVFSLTNNLYTFYAGSTIEYGASGVQNIDNNLTYMNLTLAGSGNKTGNGNLNVAGNLTIDSPAVLVPSTAINIGGNWTDYSTVGFSETGSTVTFNGPGNQIMTVRAGENFATAILNKTGGYLILDSASRSKMIIATSLILTYGIIIGDTTSTATALPSVVLNYVFFNNGAAVSGANNNSFVYGIVGRLGSTPFTFPVGKGSEYRPVSVSPSSSLTMYAQYFHQDPDLGAPVYPTAQVTHPVDSVSRCEYWTLETQPSSGSAIVTLSWDTYSCGVTDPGALLVARDASSATNWTSFGNGGTTGTVAQGTISSSSTVSFTAGSTAAFALADTSFPVNPLPVSLLSFTGTAEKNDVLLKWSTASEINNNYFTIEKSADGNKFASIGEVKGAGSSTSEINYTYIDNAPFPGLSYYRLKQTDYNGNYYYSQTIAINYSKQQRSTFTLFPNPAFDRAYINVSWEIESNIQVKSKTYTLHVFDVSGREAMPQQVINFSYGMLQPLDVSVLPKGVYMLQLNDGKEIQRTSLVKD